MGTVRCQGLLVYADTANDRPRLHAGGNTARKQARSPRELCGQAAGTNAGCPIEVLPEAGGR